jgi:hypothetical protein
LHAWDDSAFFFDGTCIGKWSLVYLPNLYLFFRTLFRPAAYIFAFAVYMTVTIPSLRTIVIPVEGDTREDRIEAMRVLSAGNTIIVVILVGVLILQVSVHECITKH